MPGDQRLLRKEVFKVRVCYQQTVDDSGQSRSVEVDCYALVDASSGTGAVQQAAELALRATVGDPPDWVSRNAYVKSIKHLGTAVMLPSWVRP